jgi:hypothetical protein
MTLVKFEPWHQYLQNIPMKTEVKCSRTQQSLTNYMETFKEEEHIWQEQDLMGKKVSGELRSLFNLLKTEHRLLYLKAQFVPRCKHFSTWL